MYLLTGILSLLTTHFQKPRYTTVDQFTAFLKRLAGTAAEHGMSEAELEVAEAALAAKVVTANEVDQKWGKIYRLV